MKPNPICLSSPLTCCKRELYEETSTSIDTFLSFDPSSENLVTFFATMAGWLTVLSASEPGSMNFLTTDLSASLGGIKNSFSYLSNSFATSVGSALLTS